MKNTTDRLKEISKRLQHYKTTNPRPKPNLDDYEDNSRHNYCHLVLFHNNKPHLFEVRGFKELEDKIQVSAVNWSLCAGTCSLDLTVKFIEYYKIEVLEDSPSIQTLFGY